MAMLAQKSIPSGVGMSPATSTPSTASTTTAASGRDFSGNAPTRRAPMIPGATTLGSNTFVSPTESEFSEAFEGPDSVRTWDEKRVGEWLRSIGCGQYEQTFKANDVTGSNLIECDQAVLKEMGIKKVGDRVRIFVAIKTLRNAAVGNHKKRNRDSIMALDSKIIYTPSSTTSPRHLTVNKDRGLNSSMANKRSSRQFEVTSLDPFYALAGSLGRPSSPLADPTGTSRAHRYGNSSPMEQSRNLSSQGHSSNPSSANTATGRRPETSATSKTSSGRTNMDSTMGRLPSGSSVIRVIYNGGQTKVIDVKGCKEADDITLAVLRKLGLPENHVNNYCFYMTDGIDTDGSSCRRLPDVELLKICLDPKGFERGRLILRKLHAGEPNVEEVRKAAGIYAEEMSENYQTAIVNNNTHSRSKIEKLTGESWDAVKNPLSSATFHASQIDRVRAASTSPANEYGLPQRTSSRRAPKKPLRQFLGGRPPSELISQELSTYFPDHKKDEIERTVSMSQRRSARLSKAADRLSIASSISIASSFKDAPPLPSIADTWLIGGKMGLQKGPRPLSVSRFPGHRDSIVSTLQPLPEESPTEAHRASFVSFDSTSEPSNVSITDPDGQTRQSYYDDSGSSQHGTDTNSLNEQYRQVLAQDGEGPDPELEQFLGDDSWDHVKWMQGSLIGQGSFGSVFLGLLVMTGELMAVKQVEMPSNTNSDIDKRKEVMVAALRREIDLLRDLQHPNIVQYLGANCDEEHFNIFLEYVPGGSIAAMLNNYGHLQEPLIRNFVRQILDGLSYLHGKDIIHRDIKGANVLIDNKGKVKISDFGISKRVEASALLGPSGTKAGGGPHHLHRPSLQGSVFWMAPEVVKQTSYTRKADIWSLGCLIVEMFTGTHPFPNCSQLQAIFQIGGTGAKPSTPEAASPEAQAFLARTFEHDYERRPSADELLLSPFLKQIA